MAQDIRLDQNTICPILLYGCENWGTLSTYKINNNNLSLFETFKDWDFEKLNIKFCHLGLENLPLCTVYKKPSLPY
jgi:hypothetical protein